MQIIFEDKNIIVIEKASGEASQSDKTGEKSLVDMINAHMKANNEGKKQAFVVHRLDRPVSGLMVYAKTKESAGDLSKQAQSGKLRKKYLAVVQGMPEAAEGELKHFLLKDEPTNASAVVDSGTKNAKEAILRYRVLETVQDPEAGTLSLLEILLITGRHHQIRVQLSAIGCPIWGDTKYNPNFVAQDGWYKIALFASLLSFYHPVQNKPHKYTLKPSGDDLPWNLFSKL